MNKLLTSLIVGTTAIAMAGSVAAASIADVYQNRTVTILVGYGAGGTYGQTSLMLARHFGRLIPGNPTVIVQHMPGAGGIKAANYAYAVMPKNGLNVLMPPEMSVVSQLLRPKKVKYKTNEFTWLGTVFGANQVMIVRRDTGIKTIGDLKKKQIIVASTGAGSPTFLVPKMMNALLGTKFKIITGYRGSAKTSLSVESGETFGMTNSWVSWKKNRPHWFDGTKKSFALQLLQVGFSKEKDLQGLPLLTDLVQEGDDKAIAAMLSTASVIGRGLVFPPGVPNSLIEPIRGAFWATVTDKQFVSDATNRRLPVIPLKGVEIQKIVNNALQMSPQAVAKARKHIFGK
jgi:tripartite-type tricarboxylate transporter receptor subunit TctC